VSRIKELSNAAAQRNNDIEPENVLIDQNGMRKSGWRAANRRQACPVGGITVDKHTCKETDQNSGSGCRDQHQPHAEVEPEAEDQNRGLQAAAALPIEEINCSVHKV
jgi:hypothetical protein